MGLDRTLFIVKPDAVGANQAGSIVSMVESNGFRVVAMKMLVISRESAAKFYKEHSERAFYDSLINYMSSGPVIVCVLSANDAVARLRTLIGHTDPQKADPKTIRALYGKSIEANAVHASDSNDSAVNEVKFFFAEREIRD